MPIQIGEIAALFRYPVKSMGGEPLQAADLGWHGLAGDRRLAFRRTEVRDGFPWLTASRLPELLLFSPRWRGPAVEGDLPTHVRTPDGEELPVFGPGLAAEVGSRLGSPVEMMHFDRGIFDEASVSVITSATVAEVGRLVAQPADVRRFRPNILIAAAGEVPFAEDEWVGGVLSFGDTDAALAITHRDERCSMVNFDPDSARPTPEVLKAIARLRDNKAGVYAAVTRPGRLAVGQPVFLEPAPALMAVHPVLGSGDVEASLAFYRELGFREVFRDRAHQPRYAAVVRDAVELHLQWNDAVFLEGGDKPVYRFLVRDVDALFAEMSSAIRSPAAPASTSPWAAPGDTPWGTREFHLRDPFGNGLQFYAPR